MTWDELLSQLEKKQKLVGHTSRDYMKCLKQLKKQYRNVEALKDNEILEDFLGQFRASETKKQYMKALKFVKKNVWADVFVDFAKVVRKSAKSTCPSRKQVLDVILWHFQYNP